LFGKTISEKQYWKIRNTSPTTVTMMLDADARPELLTLARRFLERQNRPVVKVALLPDGDPNSMRDRLSETILATIPNLDQLFMCSMGVTLA
jgi:hypothetical protein